MFVFNSSKIERVKLLEVFFPFFHLNVSSSHYMVLHNLVLNVEHFLTFLYSHSHISYLFNIPRVLSIQIEYQMLGERLHIAL